MSAATALAPQRLKARCLPKGGTPMIRRYAMPSSSACLTNCSARPHGLLWCRSCPGSTLPTWPTNLWRIQPRLTAANLGRPSVRPTRCGCALASSDASVSSRHVSCACPTCARPSHASHSSLSSLPWRLHVQVRARAARDLFGQVHARAASSSRCWRSLPQPGCAEQPHVPRAYSGGARETRASVGTAGTAGAGHAQAQRQWWPWW